jgi:hypothetical protein
MGWLRFLAEARRGAREAVELTIVVPDQYRVQHLKHHPLKIWVRRVVALVVPQLVS